LFRLVIVQQAPNGPPIAMLSGTRQRRTRAPWTALLAFPLPSAVTRGIDGLPVGLGGPIFLAVSHCAHRQNADRPPSGRHDPALTATGALHLDARADDRAGRRRAKLDPGLGWQSSSVAAFALCWKFAPRREWQRPSHAVLPQGWFPPPPSHAALPGARPCHGPTLTVNGAKFAGILSHYVASGFAIQERSRPTRLHNKEASLSWLSRDVPDPTISRSRSWPSCSRKA